LSGRFRTQKKPSWGTLGCQRRGRRGEKEGEEKKGEKRVKGGNI